MKIIVIFAKIKNSEKSFIFNAPRTIGLYRNSNIVDLFITSFYPVTKSATCMHLASLRFLYLTEISYFT